MQVSCGDTHSLFLTEEGEVIAAGNNQYGQCGFNPQESVGTDVPCKLLSLTEHNVVQVSAGLHHSLFLTSLGVCFRTCDSDAP